MNPQLSTALHCACSAGQTLLRHFGNVGGIRIKDSRSSIVTEADLAADSQIRSLLQAREPHHNLLTEESGYLNQGSDFTWVIDPLDGTSNFAAGIPWFGVMVTLLQAREPIAAVMHLPAEELTYTAARGEGALCNGKPVTVSSEIVLENVLCAFGLDAGSDPQATERQGETLGRVAQAVRNVRSTNSLVDFAFTIDGRLGACVNFHAMLWDIVAPALILQEAGGTLTDLTGQPLDLSLGADACQKSYAVAGGAPVLHRQIVQLIK